MSFGLRQSFGRWCKEEEARREMAEETERPVRIYKRLAPMVRLDDDGPGLEHIDLPVKSLCIKQLTH